MINQDTAAIPAGGMIGVAFFSSLPFPRMSSLREQSVRGAKIKSLNLQFSTETVSFLSSRGTVTEPIKRILVTLSFFPGERIAYVTSAVIILVSLSASESARKMPNSNDKLAEEFRLFNFPVPRRSHMDTWNIFASTIFQTREHWKFHQIGIGGCKTRDLEG
jgi:hypothetical protein